VRRRTKAREFALKALYQCDVLGELPPESIQVLSELEPYPSDVLAFGRELIDGCIRNMEAIDGMIESVAENWRLNRMPTVDRNILRLATCELVFRLDTPPKAAINEAIELAKKFSTENSGTYVNALLDRIMNRYATHRIEELKESADGMEQEPGARDPFADMTPLPSARADMHMHSTASDGSLSPREVVWAAAGKGLAAMSLTDHDSVEGLTEASEAAEEAGILLIPGVELTAYSPAGDPDAPEHEVHILGYFVDPGSSELLDELERLRRVRSERVEKIAERLEALCVPVSPAAVHLRAAGGAVGRVHVAQEMVRAGHCKCVQEAFDRYLAAGRPAYVCKEHLLPGEAIGLIHAAGGCAVLAHPGTCGLPEALPETLKGDGLDGIEVHCPAHSADDEARFMDLAKRLDLAITGGSDFHGSCKPSVEIGAEFVSLVEVCDLAARRKRVRERSGTESCE